jgi:phage repressor protein C with HTH and peptisase S24 domain
MSVRETADAIQRAPSTYSSYEDKYKKEFLPMDLVLSLARVWVPKGVAEADVMALAGVRMNPRHARQREPEPPAVHYTQRSTADRIPVLGMAEGGEGGWSLWNGDVIDYVPRPSVLAGVPNAYAVYVTGSSMEPRYYPGELLYVHPGKPITPGAFVVIELHPQTPEDAPRGLLKRLARRTPQKLVLAQYNPEKTFEIKASEVKNIHRIVGAGEA